MTVEGKKLVVFSSHRLEDLAARLASELWENPVPADVADSFDFLTPEVVVVPSRGMEKWLSMKIMEKTAIAANFDFAFPEGIVKKIVAATKAVATKTVYDPEKREFDVWAPSAITWKILEVLPSLLKRPEFLPVKKYLDDMGDVTGQPSSGGMHSGVGDAAAQVDRKEYALAGRIASMFDEYTIYRPDWIDAWAGVREVAEKSVPAIDEKNQWQPLLFKAVWDAIGVPHYVSQIDEIVALLEKQALPIPCLPSRLTLFGIPTLPPVYLKIFTALGKRIDVSMFVLAPVEGYLADVATRYEKLREIKKHEKDTSEDLHLESNPLVASMGKIARDFNLLLIDNGFETPAPGEDYEMDHAHEDGESQLARIQRDIVELRTSIVGDIQEDHVKEVADIFGKTAIESEKVLAEKITAPDSTIMFHSCHGDMRQVEILRDEILNLFQEHADLQPRDIVVMSPRIDDFAPLIKAVFDDGDGDGKFKAADERQSETGNPAKLGDGDLVSPGFPKLRHSIADRSMGATNPAVSALVSILKLADGRRTASEVLDVLAQEPVVRKFRFSKADLELIRRLIDESGARWGQDAQHKLDEGLPEDERFTWRYAISRLLVGAAMESVAERVVKIGDREILPYDKIEGRSARVMGRFVSFLGLLDELAARIKKRQTARTLGFWTQLSREVLETFVEFTIKNHWQLRKVKDELKGIDDFVGVGDGSGDGFGRPITLDTFLFVIENAFGSAISTSGLWSGGINFCGLVPMRSIPFKVICLLGMDDQVFPRQGGRTAFDLIGKSAARAGDRSPRDDDRFMFLSTLMSARRAFIVTYNGQGIRDNEKKPPAVPVAELLDVISHTFTIDGKKTEEVRNTFVVNHPLQAFSKKNFDPKNALSFDRRALHGAKARAMREGFSVRSFFDNFKPLDFAGEMSVSVDALATFLMHPVKIFMNKRLNVDLGIETVDITDRETIELNHLQEWSVRSRLLAGVLGKPDAGANTSRSDKALADMTLRDKNSYEMFKARTRPVVNSLLVGPDLPIGVMGQLAADQMVNDTYQCLQSLPVWPLGERRKVGVVDGQLISGVENLGFFGSVDDVYDAGLIQINLSKIKAKYRLKAWVRHLTACIYDEGFSGWTWIVSFSGSTGIFEELTESEKAYLVSQNVETLYSAPLPERAENAMKILSELLNMYRVGMTKPLLFIPEAAYSYAREFIASKDVEKAKKLAKDVFKENGDVGRASFREGNDPYWVALLGDISPFGYANPMPNLCNDESESPESLALKVWGPYLEAVERARSEGQTGSQVDSDAEVGQ